MKIFKIEPSLMLVGTYTGSPFTFIRFAGCNTGCKFCNILDIAEGKSYKNYTASQLAKEANGNIFLTGGEIIQQNIDDIVSFLQICKKRKDFIVIETTGLNLDLINILKPWVSFWSFNIKLTSEGIGYELEAITKLTKFNNSEFKIRVNSITDISEVIFILQNTKNLCKKPIYIFSNESRLSYTRLVDRLGKHKIFDDLSLLTPNIRFVPLLSSVTMADPTAVDYNSVLKEASQCLKPIK